MTKTIRYYVLIAAIVILIVELVMSDFNNFFHWKNVVKFLIPILIIISMYGSTRHLNKHGEK